MRRGMLLAVGFGISAVLAMVLAGRVMAQYTKLAVESPAQLELPCTVGDTQMTVVELTGYDGPFWEDGTGRTVANVAAIVVENTGGTVADAGWITLFRGDECMTFEFSVVKPGERVLIPERDAKPCSGSENLKLHGWVRRSYPEDNGAVTALESASGALVVTNHTGAEIPLVTVRYKAWDQTRGMYLGGITFESTVAGLMPGESREITPAHYKAGYSKIVGLCWVCTYSDLSVRDPLSVDNG